MSHLRSCLFAIACAFLFAACNTDFTEDPAARLRFSVDTLRFDTVFTAMTTVTMQMRIYNPQKQPMRIDAVTMEDGRFFRINIDGETDAARLRDIRIEGRDSLFLFVKACIDPNNNATPVLVEDALHFSVNNRIQTVRLEAYGQDVEILRQKTLLTDTLLAGEKPYLVYDRLTVDTACTLTVAAGTTFYMHDNAALVVYGNLDVCGTLGQPVTFRCDRLDRLFTHVPYTAVAGKWNGIYLLRPSEQETPARYSINYADITGGTVGIYCMAEDKGTLPTLTLTNSRIHNFSQYGLVLQNTDAQAANNEISNCAQYCLYLAGGEHTFVHNTVASYFRNTDMQIQPVGREDVAAVYINNLSKNNAPTHTWFTNNIIAGIRSNNLVLATPLPDAYVGAFSHNCLRADSAVLGIFRDNLYLDPADTLFLSTYYAYNEYRYYDFHLDSVAPARGIAEVATAELYPLDRDGNPRLADGQPDAGCYEWTPELSPNDSHTAPVPFPHYCRTIAAPLPHY